MKISIALRDSLMLVLRKAMFSRYCTENLLRPCSIKYTRFTVLIPVRQCLLNVDKNETESDSFFIATQEFRSTKNCSQWLPSCVKTFQGNNMDQGVLSLSGILCVPLQLRVRVQTASELRIGLSECDVCFVPRYVRAT